MIPSLLWENINVINGVIASILCYSIDFVRESIECSASITDKPKYRPTP